MGEFLNRLHRAATEPWMLALVYLIWGLSALKESMTSPTTYWLLWYPNLAAGVMAFTIAGMFAFRGMPR